MKTADDFLALCLALLEHRGFKIDRILEGTGPDGGRDLEAYTFETDASGIADKIKWWVELKYRTRSRASLGVKDISSKVRRAAAHGAQKFLLITNTRTTQHFLHSLDMISEQERIVFRVWDLVQLERLQQDLEPELGTAPKAQGGILLSDRLDELSRLIPLVESGIRTVLCISGPAGVGKSALVRYLLHYFSRDYSCGLVDCRMRGDFGFHFKLLASSFRAMGERSAFANSSDLQLVEEERKDLLLQHCEGKPTIVVFDNFEEVLTPGGMVASPLVSSMLEHFLTRMMNGSVILLVSRIPPLDPRINAEANYDHVELAGWDIDFVLQQYLPYLQYLRTRLAEIEDGEQQRREVLEIFKGNPLALKIANQLCAHYDLRKLISFLRSHGEGDMVSGLIDHLAQEVTKEQLQALQRLALFNRPLSREEIQHFVCSEALLDRLVFRGLVEPISSREEQYHIHLLTAQRVLVVSRNVREELVEELFTAIRGRIADSKEGIDSLYNHGLMRQAINMLLQVNRFEDAARVLCDIGTRAVSLGDVEYLNGLLEALGLGTSETKVDAITEARLMKVKGHILDLTGEHLRAEEVYQEMLGKGMELEDAWVRAAALNGCASIERYRGNSERAISLYSESLQVRLEIGDRAGQSNSYHNLGAVYLEMGDLESARECLQQALAIRRETGDRFRASASELYLAESLIHLGDFEQARQLLRSCVETKLQLRDTVGLLWAKLALIKAAIMDRTTDGESVLEDAAWCVDTSQRMRHARGEMMAKVLKGAVEICYRGDSDAAVKALIEAQRIAKGLNPIHSRTIEGMIRSIFDVDTDIEDRLASSVATFKI